MDPEVLVEVTVRGESFMPPLVRLASKVMETLFVEVVAKVATSLFCSWMDNTPPEKLTVAGVVRSSMRSRLNR